MGWCLLKHAQIQWGGVGMGHPDPLWKITRGNRAIGFLRNTGMDPPQEAIAPYSPPQFGKSQAATPFLRNTGTDPFVKQVYPLC